MYQRRDTDSNLPCAPIPPYEPPKIVSSFDEPGVAIPGAHWGHYPDYATCDNSKN